MSFFIFPFGETIGRIKYKCEEEEEEESSKEKLRTNSSINSLGWRAAERGKKNYIFFWSFPQNPFRKQAVKMSHYVTISTASK